MSHQGCVRLENQDCISAKGIFFAVADGMGGHKGGDVASATAIKTLEDRLSAYQAGELSPQKLEKAISEANKTVFKAGANNPEELGGMGTTLCVLCLTGKGLKSEPGKLNEGMSFESTQPPNFLAGNVGDSRLYEFVSDELIQITTDHNSAPNLLTRAVGTNAKVKTDIWQLESFSTDSFPKTAFPKTCRYLLCTDGLTNELSNDTLTEVLNQLPFPASSDQLKLAAENLLEMALENGGNDNISLILIEGTLHD